MLDDATTEPSAPLPHCMWCSAELPSDAEVTCPSCGATLIGEGDNQVPGVTAIDAEALIRSARTPKPKQRSRLMSWISGEYADDDKPAAPGSLSPPPPAVRREMLRLELEARVANLQAEAGAIAAEAAVESGTPINFVEVDASAVADAALPDVIEAEPVTEPDVAGVDTAAAEPADPASASAARVPTDKDEPPPS
jgi:hypothetical protein